jgi:uncharacterized protein YeaC (DUF1315 family)
MNIEQLVAGMTPEIFTNLQTAVETGKWANGETLSDEQKDNALQAVMLYQAKIAKTNEHMTIGENGEMVHKSKSELRRELSEESEIFRTKL